MYAYGIEHGVHLRVYAMLTHWLLGDREQARAVQEQMLAEARAAEHAHTLAFALAFSSVLESVRRDVAAALATTAEAIAFCEEHSFQLMRALSQLIRGWALGVAGAPETGLTLVRRSWDSAQQLQVLVLMPYLEALWAETLGRCGQMDEADDTIARAFALAEQTGETVFLAQMREIAAWLRTRALP